MERKPAISRRDFLKLATRILLALSGALGLGMIARLLSYQSNPPRSSEFDLGPVEDFPPGSRTVLKQVPAILIHQTEGFTAISLTCTHLGCTLEKMEDGFACPCHGSQFDQVGRRVKGPAVKDLPRLQVVENDSGHLILSMEQ